MKQVIISVSNDVVTDQRINKVAETLLHAGVNITIIGRKLKDSLPGDELPYKIRRFRLLFNKGPLFYAALNIRLFFYLLFKKLDLLVANDLDTLLANFMVSKIRGKPLVYDTHEYFTGIPEIQNRKLVKTIWEIIERKIFPKLLTIYTVNQSIANLYINKYDVEVQVIRNFSRRYQNDSPRTRRELGLPEQTRIVILQGMGINMDRGGEEAVQSMQYVDNAILLIIGGGQAIGVLKNMVNIMGLQSKVIFKPKMPYVDLMEHTVNADLGISLDKDTNINYKYSLPNKLFDYIQAEIPILASDLVEVKNIIKIYGIGEIIQSYEPKIIAQKIHECLSNEERYLQWKANLKLAAQELCWENEKNKLLDIYEKAGLIPNVN